MDAVTVDASFSPERDQARQRDQADPLRAMAARFHRPIDDAGQPKVYLCGNSLGLQPKATRASVEIELDAWERLAVDGHFEGRRPWYRYHERCRGGLSRLVGADEDEVVAMNGLTVNLHLLMASFYRPTAERYRILIEAEAFPSDNYAVRSQLRFHGFDPDDGLVLARPRDGESTLRHEDLEALIDEQGERLALVLLPGVQYFTGQRFDLARLARRAHRWGALFGTDLAHAVGNVPLSLHADEIDFAVWCSYKYLNSGPGAVAGAFVHRRHTRGEALPRMAGWWGNDPERRFRMHLEEEFVPVASADAWQLSNPPILAIAPLLTSLELFDEAGLDGLRKKSEALTGYLEAWVRRSCADQVEIISPVQPEQRGCQLSCRVRSGAEALFEALRHAGIVVDVRKPDVVRLAPVPLYNGFEDVWRVGRVLEAWAGA